MLNKSLFFRQRTLWAIIGIFPMGLVTKSKDHGHGGRKIRSIKLLKDDLLFSKRMRIKQVIPFLKKYISIHLTPKAKP